MTTATTMTRTTTKKKYKDNNNTNAYGINNKKNKQTELLSIGLNIDVCFKLKKLPAIK